MYTDVKLQDFYFFIIMDVSFVLHFSRRTEMIMVGRNKYICGNIRKINVMKDIIVIMMIKS